MTMHLCGPALTLTGKKKGKFKFRNAEEARRARELAADWEQLKNRWAVPAPTRRRKPVEPLSGNYQLTTPPGRETTQHLPSVDTGGPHVTGRAVKVYTGTKVLGVTVVHKSCLQPVFSQQEAIDAAKMRRG
jgi:hypothetical protein